MAIFLFRFEKAPYLYSGVISSQLHKTDLFYRVLSIEKQREQLMTASNLYTLIQQTDSLEHIPNTDAHQKFRLK